MSDMSPVFASRERSVTDEAGVLYCAYGAHAMEEAVFSARSLKACSDIKAAIFTDLPGAAANSAMFDHVLPFEPFHEFEHYFVKAQRLPSLKLFPLLASPFAKTVHLDCDTYVKADFGELFKLLRHFDILLTQEALTEMGLADPDTGQKQHMGLKQLTQPAALNAGVFGYSNTPEATAFLKFWIAQFIELVMADPDSGNWRGTNDQGCLNKIFKQSVIQKTAAKHVHVPNYIYNATGRMLPELHRIDMFDRVKVMHSHFCLDWHKSGHSMETVFEHPRLAAF